MFTTLLLLIFILPLASSLSPSEYIAPINTWFCIVLLAFLGLWTITKGLSLKKKEMIYYPLSLFACSIFLGVFFSQDTAQSVKAIPKYAAGILLFLAMGSITEKKKLKVIQAIRMSAVVISLLALRQYFFGFSYLIDYVQKTKSVDSVMMSYISQRRVFAPFETPNLLGGYLSMVLPFFLSFKIWILSIVLFALLFTKSIGALLSLLIGLTVYFHSQKRLNKKKIFLISILGLVICFVFIQRTADSALVFRPLFSIIKRLQYWGDAFVMILKNPFAGAGLGNFMLPQCDYVHNSYLQIWGEMGISGFLSFLWLLWATILRGIRAIKATPQNNTIAMLLSANVVFLLHNLFDSSFFFTEVSLLWWAILGLLYFSGSAKRSSDPDTGGLSGSASSQ